MDMKAAVKQKLQHLRSAIASMNPPEYLAAMLGSGKMLRNPKAGYYMPRKQDDKSKMQPVRVDTTVGDVETSNETKNQEKPLNFMRSYRVGLFPLIFQPTVYVVLVVGNRRKEPLKSIGK